MVISKNRSIQKGKKTHTAMAAVTQAHGQHGFFPLSLGAIIPEDGAAGKRQFLILGRFLHCVHPALDLLGEKYGCLLFRRYIF